ncbi:hypothetical protein [uncultured Jatrophihabitans sp.]|uniref:hypothetical protein n=1 Tax=uncultured Jatrophihabitans sp. TaxID=1610747 RepID=UPI0035CA86AD
MPPQAVVPEAVVPQAVVPQAVVALAVFVRDRLAEVSVTFGPGGAARATAPRNASRALAARQVSTAIIGAEAPFAANSYARVRLLRQLHAAGMLSAAGRRADPALAPPAACTVLA